MRRSRALLVALATTLIAVAAIAAYSASAMAPGMTKANVTIHHSWWGCHTWAVNSGEANVQQHLYLRAGHALTLRNRDNCEQQLVQTKGPEDVQMTSSVDGLPSDGYVAPLGAPVLVRMLTPGTYEFTTVEGLHTDGLTTLLPGFFQQPSYGPDNELTLQVTVLPARMDFTD